MIRFVIELIIFYLLVLLNILVTKKSFPFFNISKSDFAIDIISLLIQGFFVPLFGIFILNDLYFFFFPQIKSTIDLSFLSSFLLSFVFVDYIYYLSHKALHSRSLWKFHIVHHSAKEMNILNTSRNSLIAHFLLPYIWLNSLFIYLLKNPEGYIIGFSLTAMMDLWRHSELYPENSNNAFFKFFETIFITPKHHSWHHSNKEFNNFYGANLIIWDKIHKTTNPNLSTHYPKHLGMNLNKSVPILLFRPDRIFSSKHKSRKSK